MAIIIRNISEPNASKAQELICKLQSAQNHMQSSNFPQHPPPVFVVVVLFVCLFPRILPIVSEEAKQRGGKDVNS